MIYFLRVHSHYFYPIKAYFNDMEKLLSFVTYFIENPEFISDEAKDVYKQLPPRTQKAEMREMFSILIIDGGRRYNYKDLFFIDGIKRVGIVDEAEHKASEAKIQDATDDKNREDGGGESEDGEFPDAA